MLRELGELASGYNPDAPADRLVGAVRTALAEIVEEVIVYPAGATPRGSRRSVVVFGPHAVIELVARGTSAQRVTWPDGSSVEGDLPHFPRVGLPASDNEHFIEEKWSAYGEGWLP